MSPSSFFELPGFGRFGTLIGRVRLDVSGALCSRTPASSSASALARFVIRSTSQPARKHLCLARRIVGEQPRNAHRP